MSSADCDMPFIVWNNYEDGCWTPWGFKTQAEACDFIARHKIGGPCVLTRRMELHATDLSAVPSPASPPGQASTKATEDG